MGFADFSQFVVTTANETACETSPIKVRTLSLHLSATFTLFMCFGNLWTSLLLASLSHEPSLVCDFCSSDQRFAYSFLQISPHGEHPCCSAMYFPLPRRTRDFHPLEPAHGGQTSKRRYQLKLIPPSRAKPLKTSVFTAVCV